MTPDRTRGLQSNQERVVRAVAEAVHEVGPHRLTATRIIERAGLSRSTFYGLFENSADALAFSLTASRRIFASLFDPAAREQAWRARIAAAIVALVEQAEAEPYLLELYLVHQTMEPALGGAMLQPLTDALTPDGAQRTGPLSNLRPEEFIALGITSVVAERLRRGEKGPWTRLAAELTEFATLTLVGTAAHHQEP